MVVRVGHLTDSSLVARKLLDIEMWACASPTYLARRGMPDGFADLRPTTSSAGRTGPRDGPSVVRAEGAKPWRCHPAPWCRNRLPDFVAREAVDRGKLVRLWPDWQGDNIPAYALYLSHRSLSAKVRVFLDALVASLKSLQLAR